jgi:hypothetical protein
MPFNEKGEWKPNNPKQIQFLSLPLSIREAMFGGGAGSGKSELLLMYGIVNGWHEHPLFKQVFMRRTYKELKLEIVGRSRDMYARLGATYNKSDLVWTFPRPDQFGGTGLSNSGAQIFFGHCEHEDDVHNYDSMEINLFTPDELTSFTEFIYTYIAFTRVRSSAPGILPAITRGSGMPGDIGHTWVKKRFPKSARPGTIIIGKGGNKRIYIHSTARDNKNVDPNYVQGLSALNESERRAKEDGDWDSYEGSVFDEFRERKIPEEPENALHVIDKFDIPKHWPRICAIDWGFSAMCSVGWAAISPTKRVYIYRHQYFFREKIEEWAPKVRHFVDSDIPNDIVICHSANQHRGDPHTILEQVTDALGCSVNLGPRDRIGTKLLLHEYLRWKSKPIIPLNEQKPYDEELAQWIRRNKTEEEYFLYLKSFSPEVEEIGIPRLLFFNAEDVKLIWEAIKQCKYEKDTKDGKKVEDVAEFNGDDPYDMLRNLLYSADRWFEESKTEQDRLEEREKISINLSRTQDMTSFYNQMRKLESGERSNGTPVRRFHRGRR